MGGTVRWFTDFTARHQFPYTVIFPVDDEMTTIVCGNEPPQDNCPPPIRLRAASRNRLGDVYFTDHRVHQQLRWRIAVCVLSERKNPRIGWSKRP